MKRANGFTLIELIIVIVILGILAVTAAPQFFNFSSDARSATLKGLEGSIISGSEMVFARATIAGVESSDQPEEIELRGVEVPVRFGYPSFVPASGGASEEVILAQVQAVFNLEPNDWEYAGNQANASFRVAPRGLNDDVALNDINSINRCYVEYVAPAAAGNVPAISAVTTGC